MRVNGPALASYLCFLDDPQDPRHKYFGNPTIVWSFLTGLRSLN